MIDRNQVLHVARLARLILDEQEIVAMQRDLGSVLDHIETIGELALDDVVPTAHVIELTAALRADEPVDSLSRQATFAGAPAVSDDGFIVPSPQA